MSSLQLSFALGENCRSICFLEEEKAGSCVDRADDKQDPKDPSPVQALNDDAAKEWTEGRTHERTKEIPTKNPCSLPWLKHIAE